MTRIDSLSLVKRISVLFLLGLAMSLQPLATHNGYAQGGSDEPAAPASPTAMINYIGQETEGDRTRVILHATQPLDFRGSYEDGDAIVLRIAHAGTALPTSTVELGSPRVDRLFLAEGIDEDVLSVTLAGVNAASHRVHQDENEIHVELMGAESEDDPESSDTAEVAAVTAPVEDEVAETTSGTETEAMQSAASSQGADEQQAVGAVESGVTQETPAAAEGQEAMTVAEEGTERKPTFVAVAAAEPSVEPIPAVEPDEVEEEAEAAPAVRIMGPSCEKRHIEGACDHAPVNKASFEPVEKGAAQPIPAAGASAEDASAATAVQPLDGMPGAFGQTSSGRTLHVAAGRSITVETEVAVKRVSISNPEVAEPIAISPSQLLVNGLKPGVVSLVLWPNEGEAMLYDLIVQIDAEALSSQVDKIFPNESVRVQSSKDSIVLTGEVSSLDIRDKVIQLAEDYSPKVIDHMSARAARRQIKLAVKFAEVSRSALTELGAVLHHVDPTAPTAFDRGTVGTGEFSPPGGNLINDPIGPDLNWTDAINLSYFEKSIDLGLFITALKSRGLFQSLAEPNLIAAEGGKANFLAGGEFPVPVAQVSTGSTAITIEWKKFGISLDFEPVIRDDNVIVMKVRPEVSALDFSNAVVLEGFRIPAVTVRRTETEVELTDGQSFAIAGLYDQSLSQTKSKIPILGDIPLLKYLFRSKNLQKNRTELLVIVTPTIVEPASSVEQAGTVEMPESFELYKREKF